MTQITEAYDFSGRTLVDSDGDKIGKVEEVYLDTETCKPEWALVQTGKVGKKSHFVPLRDAQANGEDVRVAFDKDSVKDAPSIDPGQELSQEAEAALYSHYGLDYSESRSDSGLPETGAEPTGHDTSGPTTDDAMTRSEEEVTVGKTRRESGRARLVKYVVTEEVQQTVPVQHEEVRIEREPITDENAGAAMDGPEISSEEHEVVLHEEQPVVEKRTVPKERVRMDKDVVTEETQVSEEVRKEQIETEGDGRR